MHKCLNEFNIPFFSMVNSLSQFIFTDIYLKFKDIEHFIHYIKFEVWVALFYVNSLYFQQWNLKLVRNIFQFILRFSKLGFLNLDLRLYFNIFPNTKRLKIGICKCCSSWTSQFFPAHEREWTIGMFNSAYFHTCQIARRVF